MPQKIDLTGKRFGRLVVLKELPERKNNNIIWECQCDCGKKVTVQGTALRVGHTKSCGCLKIDMCTEMGKRPPKKPLSRESKTRLYRIWKDMRRRTTNPKRQNYHRYGGRGIRVCDEWMNSYQSFKNWAHDNGYNDSLSIDRINPDGNYCPENCRWATKKEQARNRSNTRVFTYNGDTKTLIEWSEITGVPYTTLIKKVNEGKTDNIFRRGGDPNDN